MILQNLAHKEYTHGHLFCGIGAGAKGFNKSSARHGKLTAEPIWVRQIAVALSVKTEGAA